MQHLYFNHSKNDNSFLLFGFNRFSLSEVFKTWQRVSLPAINQIKFKAKPQFHFGILINVYAYIGINMVFFCTCIVYNERSGKILCTDEKYIL